MKNPYLSSSERLILLFLSGSLMTTYFLDIFYSLLVFIVTPSSGAIDFCVYCPNPFPISKNIPILQLFLIPLLVIFIFKQNKFIFSIIVSFVSSFLYFYWVIETFWGRRKYELFDLTTETFNSYLLANSSILEFVQFLLVTIIFLAQMIFLSRFTIENFHAKISPR